MSKIKLVGGLEAEAVMLDPKVTSTDVVLTITKHLRGQYSYQSSNYIAIVGKAIKKRIQEKGFWILR